MPAAVLVLVTGTVADRFDRRRLGAFAIAGRGRGGLSCSWPTPAATPTAVGPLLGLALLGGVAGRSSAPALRSLPADIVAPERLPWLVARWAITWQSALIIGPVLAGSLYAVDVRAPFVLATVLFVVAAVALPTVPRRRSRSPRPRPAGRSRRRGAGPGPSLREALEGLRFVRRQPILLGAISLDLFAVLFGGAVALLPGSGRGAAGRGRGRASAGCGPPTGSAPPRSPACWPSGRCASGSARPCCWPSPLFGAATIVLGLTRTYAVAFVALIVASGADALSVFVRSTLVPLVTPPTMRGRVLAVENVFIGGSNELGAFESGVAGQLLGPALAVGSRRRRHPGRRRRRGGSLFPALRTDRPLPVTPRRPLAAPRWKPPRGPPGAAGMLERPVPLPCP